MAKQHRYNLPPLGVARKEQLDYKLEYRLLRMAVQELLWASRAGNSETVRRISEKIESLFGRVDFDGKMEA